ncbi:ABC transporter ATP-binding protein [Aquibacillus saliphilus]|uniref:ABC transporter ATP-binding protein n=1 Tax=Aquibacillus saliphilus TaxID=1909422 RepID=UPI001CF079AC|nr:ABC transporter ATP-binding protein [Aquibacillus saliphilus]
MSLEIKNLSVTFNKRYEKVYAVTDVSLNINSGEIVGLVGESGCGKSVTTKAILRLIGSPQADLSGSVLLDEKNLIHLKEKEMRKVRGKKISLISQNPLSSLNPVITIGEQVAEPLMQHKKIKRKHALRLAREALDRVGFPKGYNYLKRYPNEFSGGMRQRIVIAMALINEPDIIIADEPTTALDVTIQAQILNLLQDIVTGTSTSVLIISHDLTVISEMCDKIGVMYAGQIVEWGEKNKILSNPSHPYTEALISTIPNKTIKHEFMTISGQPPKLSNIPDECHFVDRCKYADISCRKGPISLEERQDGGRVRCLKPLHTS